MTNTALIAVDLQNDFTQGVLRTDNAFHVIDNINWFVRQNWSMPRFASMDWHPSIAEQSRGPVSMHHLAYGEHAVHGTWGAELDPSFAAEGFTVVRKGQQGADASAFCGVDAEGFKLDTRLHMAGVTKIIVGGLIADVCVQATALDGLALGYDVEVRRALTVGSTREAAEQAFANIIAAGGKVV